MININMITVESVPTSILYSADTLQMQSSTPSYLSITHGNCLSGEMSASSLASCPRLFKLQPKEIGDL